ncbi:hypothetical protein QVD17_30542 [Tagetes erecta]|uniref:Uncharacterized protein n=1 Tax=Tagetes erecta TaxID=13708 RepID=A0AAD8NNH5_TARER|nr:hypothetical protein QVD17_30542 [Tagetes erecta]
MADQRLVVVFFHNKEPKVSCHFLRPATSLTTSRKWVCNFAPRKLETNFLKNLIPVHIIVSPAKKLESDLVFSIEENCKELSEQLLSCHHGEEEEN